MNSSLSINTLKITSYSLSLLFCLSSCSAFKSNDHQIKDSLYVWSESFDESAEANKVVTEYQTIKSLEESIPKSDVQMIFEAMVNNEIPEIDLAEDLSQPSLLSSIDSNKSEQETLKQRNAKLKAYNAKLKEHNDKLRETINDKKGLVSQNNLPQPHLKNNAAITPTAGEVIQTPEAVAPKEQVGLTATVTKIDDAELRSPEDINRLTQTNPTAAGISIDAVLPDISKEVVEAPLPKKIQTLAAQSDPQLSNKEFGMWQLVKSDGSQYQEICSLTSSTMQLDNENYTTQVWLSVVGNGLLVNSTTNIDINKAGVGLRFDNGALKTFNKNYFQTSAVWLGDLESTLQNNKQLKIRLGGNELGQNTQEVSLSLKTLKNAYAEYRQCNKGIKIGSL